jgi:hypothetical protein
MFVHLTGLPVGRAQLDEPVHSRSSRYKINVATSEIEVFAPYRVQQRFLTANLQNASLRPAKCFSGPEVDGCSAHCGDAAVPDVNFGERFAAAFHSAC